jgi:hypothetical protein
MSHFFVSPQTVRKTYDTDPNYPAILSETTPIVPRLIKFGSFGAVFDIATPVSLGDWEKAGSPVCPTFKRRLTV